MNTTPANALPEHIGYSRMLLVGTGAIGVCDLPSLASLLVTRYGIEVCVALTEAATRLVSAEALSAITGRPVIGPGWPERPERRAEHVWWADWAELVLVWPATLDFSARCAHGLCADLPSAIVAAKGRQVLFAPSLAPGAARGRTFARIRETLVGDGHLVLGPTVGPSVTHRVNSPGACVPIPTLLRALGSATTATAAGPSGLTGEPAQADVAGQAGHVGQAGRVAATVHEPSDSAAGSGFAFAAPSSSPAPPPDPTARPRVGLGDLAARPLTPDDVEAFDRLAGVSRLDDLRQAGAPLDGVPDPPEQVLDVIVNSENIRGYLIHDPDQHGLMVMVYSESEFPGVWGAVGITAVDSAGLRGVGTVGVALTLDLMFADPKVRRMQGYVAVTNTASRRLLDRLGFREEGLLNGFLEVGENRLCDAWLMALNRAEWPGAAAVDLGDGPSLFDDHPAAAAAPSTADPGVNGHGRAIPELRLRSVAPLA